MKTKSEESKEISGEPIETTNKITKEYIDLTKKYDALELINILRAKTFDNFPSAYFIHEGKKIYVRINLQKEEKC